MMELYNIVFADTCSMGITGWGGKWGEKSREDMTNKDENLRFCMREHWLEPCVIMSLALRRRRECGVCRGA